MTSAVSPNPRLELRSPRVFTLGAILIVNAYGILLLAPVIASIVLVTLIQLGIWTVLIPLAVLAAVVMFLPFGFGNAHIVKLTDSIPPPAPENFVVQVTVTPRICTGPRAVLDDADDIGRLAVTDSHLLFNGDRLSLSMPLSQIQSVRVRHVGFRDFFGCASRISLGVSGLPNVTGLEFASRSANLLPTSRKATRQLLTRIEAGCRRASQTGSAPIKP